MPDLKEKNRIILKNSKMHELWDLGAPTILEQALQTIVAYVDTAMVGQIGAIASAAVGLTTTVNWLLNGILFAVSMGMLSFIANILDREIWKLLIILQHRQFGLFLFLA